MSFLESLCPQITRLSAKFMLERGGVLQLNKYQESRYRCQLSSLCLCIVVIAFTYLQLSNGDAAFASSSGQTSSLVLLSHQTLLHESTPPLPQDAPRHLTGSSLLPSSRSTAAPALPSRLLLPGAGSADPPPSQGQLKGVR